MTVLAQISDPHLRAGADGAGAAAALARAVDRVLGLRPAPDAVLVSGDIANSADPAEYELARALLAPLAMPVHLLAGNHDDPAAMWAPTEYAERVGGLRLVARDTRVAGSDAGALDVERLAAVLAAEPGTPTILALHHPPVPVGLPFVDEIGLPATDRAALAALLRRSPQVLRVVCGHLHRTVFATLGGCPVAVCPTTNLQVALELGARTPGAELDPPALLVHALLDDGALITHVQPV